MVPGPLVFNYQIFFLETNSRYESWGTEYYFAVYGLQRDPNRIHCITVKKIPKREQAVLNITSLLSLPINCIKHMHLSFPITLIPENNSFQLFLSEHIYKTPRDSKFVNMSSRRRRRKGIFQKQQFSFGATSAFQPAV